MQKSAILKSLTTLALPLILAQIAHMSMQVTDTLMLGRLGTVALAASALGGVIVYNACVFFAGLLSATGTLLAQAYGEKNVNKTQLILSQSVLLAIILSFLCVAVVLYFPHFLIGIDEKILTNTVVFLDTLVLGIPAWLLFFVFRDFVAVHGKPKIIMFISLSAIPLNAMFDYSLMYGKFGLPALGFVGVGFATSVVRWMMLFSLIGYIIFNSDLRSYLKLTFKINWQLQKQLCRIGMPTGCMMALEIGMFSATTMIMAYFGVAPLAAHQIAIQCANVVFTIPLGISQATNIQVGKAIGEKCQSLILPITFCALVLGSLLAMVIGFIFCFFPLSIMQLFLNVQTIDEASFKLFVVSYLSMAAILQFLDTAQIIVIGALRGLSDTFIPMLLGIIAYWLVGLSSGYFFAFYENWQGIGLWYGLCVGIGASTLFLIARLYQFNRGYKLLSAEVIT